MNLYNLLTEKREDAVLIWVCNIGAENKWFYNMDIMAGENEKKIMQRMSEINLLLCRKQDYLILNQYPSAMMLNHLQSIGVEIPHILLINTVNCESTYLSELILSDLKLLDELKSIGKANRDIFLVPYAITSFEEEISRLVNIPIIGSSSNISRIINNKVFSRKIAESLDYNICQGYIVDSLSELDRCYYYLKNKGAKKIVVKEPKGTSGKGIHIVKKDEDLSVFKLLLTKKQKLMGGKIDQYIIEEWIDDKIDINYQFFIDEEGGVYFIGVTEQVLNNCQYVGSRFFTELTKKYASRFERYSQEIGKYLFQHGYYGMVSVDSIIVNGNNIIPIIEINARFSLSTYLSFLPSILLDKCVYSEYIDMILQEKMDYDTFFAMMQDKEVLFTKETGVGVIIYNSSTFCNDYINKKSICRVFVLYIHTTMDGVCNLKQQVYDILQERKNGDGKSC